MLWVVKISDGLAKFFVHHRHLAIIEKSQLHSKILCFLKIFRFKKLP